MAKAAKYSAFLALILWIICIVMLTITDSSTPNFGVTILIILVPTISLIAVIMGILGRKDALQRTNANIAIILGIIMMIISTLMIGFLTSSTLIVDDIDTIHEPQ